MASHIVLCLTDYECKGQHHMIDIVMEHMEVLKQNRVIIEFGDEKFAGRIIHLI